MQGHTQPRACANLPVLHSVGYKYGNPVPHHAQQSCYKLSNVQRPSSQGPTLLAAAHRQKQAAAERCLLPGAACCQACSAMRRSPAQATSRGSRAAQSADPLMAQPGAGAAACAPGMSGPAQHSHMSGGGGGCLPPRAAEQDGAQLPGLGQQSPCSSWGAHRLAQGDVGVQLGASDAAQVCCRHRRAEQLLRPRAGPLGAGTPGRCTCVRSLMRHSWAARGCAAPCAHRGCTCAAAQPSHGASACRASQRACTERQTDISPVRRTGCVACRMWLLRAYVPAFLSAVRAASTQADTSDRGPCRHAWPGC